MKYTCLRVGNGGRWAHARSADAVAAYRNALPLEPAEHVRRFLTDQIAALRAASPPPGEF